MVAHRAQAQELLAGVGAWQCSKHEGGKSLRVIPHKDRTSQSRGGFKQKRAGSNLVVKSPWLLGGNYVVAKLGEK